jgi:lysophospholipid acyltransferase (LPLAT)-like uncharacterized protein
VKLYPWLVRSLSWAGTRILRRWVATLRYEHHAVGGLVDPNQPAAGAHYIYAMWHEYLLLPVFRYARPDIAVLISRHSDGQWVAEVCRQLHIPVVRGSTNRGGGEALRRMLRAGEAGHLALTPDGPRGPRQRVQPGLVYLAARTGLPIVPVGFGLERPWRMNSWDRFALPRPGSRARCVTGVPIAVPDDADREQLEPYRLQVEQVLTQVTQVAEEWAASGNRAALAALEQDMTPYLPAGNATGPGPET